MTEPGVAAAQPVISRSRVEMLFDGIFAIAMTILVLELRVPDLTNRHSVDELGRFLAQDAPTFISYVLSFSLLGILWYRHNHSYRHIEHVSRVMLVFQLLQLATAAFIPFCAALVGRYPTNPLSIVVYTGCLMVYQWASAVYWLIARRVGAIRASLDVAGYRSVRRRNLRGALIVTAIFIYSLSRCLRL